MDYKKYGNAKSISSDAYFGGGSGQDDKVRAVPVDCNPLKEARSREWQLYDSSEILPKLQYFAPTL